MGTIVRGGLIHYTPKVPSYRNQSIDLQSKSVDWFLYDGNFGVSSNFIEHSIHCIINIAFPL